MITKICPRCENPFQVYESDVNRRKYCSRFCKAPPVINSCPICGGLFRRKPSHADEQTCSLACGHELRRRNFAAKAEAALGEPLIEGLERRVKEGMRMAEIARDCGFSDTRAIHRLMADLGIARRTRSDSVKLQWKENESRRAAFGQTISEWKRSHPNEAIEHSLIGNVTLQNTSPTSIERRLMEALDQAGIAYQFQYVVGNKFLCDLAFPEAMLIVECDGEYWHSTPKQRKRDVSKDAYLQACGYTVLRLSDKQIEQNVTACVHAIQALIR
jgi:very-short-patch-repair endonuclease/AraC-like DNA-binding protein